MRKIIGFIGACFRQADMVLLALCTGTTLFGCLMIASATHYTGSYKNVIVQGAALCLGIFAYVFILTGLVIETPFCHKRTSSILEDILQHFECGRFLGVFF